ncbi:DUF4097 family beta strand repeat-containing protein [Embleya hyalina]|uniref:DUF4097 domain-containing protein n=1 Tax=Embleya hyalina TaxID=516124 RepID=A0A401Z3Y3_9ACTN|nr:DUF4097 family beta strand repeat-containing protein [Embleya hyalina]GCE01559.1 hypothetical protein EHYA_09325 [Embleya hyalina]
MIRKFVAETAGPLWVDLHCPIGTVLVAAGADLEYAEVTVSTTDETGPLAEAVRNTTGITRQEPGVRALQVRVPETSGGGVTAMNMGDVTISASGGGVAAMNISGGVSIVNGRVHVGGHVVSGNQVLVDSRATVSVLVLVPARSAIRLTTRSADLDTSGAPLRAVEATSVSGDVRVGSVQALTVHTTSGHVSADHVTDLVQVVSVAGDVDIDRYEGTRCTVSSTSGDVRMRAYPTATGTITARSVSGDVRR